MKKKDYKEFSENVFNQSKHNRKVLSRSQPKKRGFNSKTAIEQVKKRCDELNQTIASTYQRFDEFPLSPLTLKGLTDSGFEKPTPVQRDSLGWSLIGKDVVGSAKTGSGKTLALIIPILEKLWKSRWTKDDGLGALVIVPTRELAYQIFEILNSVGSLHQFSAALLIGGTDVQFQMQRMAFMNIIICTPGRLLQHLEENYSFNCDQLQILVIDEADRILDLGFRSQIDSIVSYLPKERQTLLFSATQTKSIEDLARVSVTDPVYVSVDEHSDEVTPKNLEQNYMVCNEEEKINVLWSFLVNNKRSKILIFVSCCKEARFLSEAFMHLRPGISLGGLWGTQKQTKRLEIYQSFDRKKNGAALISTDVASRGLDFTDIDWVLQLDCPNTVEDYIHRVGRTARMNKKGRGVLVLTPTQEQPFVTQLKSKGVPITQIRPDQKKIVDIRTKLMATIANFTELKEFAHGSIVAYAKSMYFAQDKEVFDVKSIDFDALALSYGLAVTPRIRFLKKRGISVKQNEPDVKNEMSKNKKKMALRELLENAKKEDNYEVEGIEIGGRKELEDNDDHDEDVLTVKKRDVFNVASDEPEVPLLSTTARKNITKEKLAKKLLKKGIPLNVNVKFDDDGTLEGDMAVKPEGLDLEEAKKEIEESNLEDKKRHKELIKKMRKERKLKKLGKLKRKDDELDLGGSADEEEDRDFSWLPDPDAPNNRVEDSAEGTSVDETMAEDTDDIAPSGKKRKLNSVQNAEEAALKMMKF
ncbi:unnamed protein product [Bursaphelenchus xylophilus]|uniref:ATP-dependent RNA helicase n=1 Tax=Bursaphelenchus xylophilus TaxID=6326 RepID=A0A1I7SDU7_BURXY|nr:unnamed protein product [Bursaphelenchus xylophilus]CAG9084261.1 unnamed protein product [Bursaphelenchus xylophilus]